MKFMTFIMMVVILLLIGYMFFPSQSKQIMDKIFSFKMSIFNNSTNGTCQVNWNCQNWSNCTNNVQQKLCLDSNYCEAGHKLIEYREC